jgi:magnesium-transporting ATPase (P-type)
MGSSKNSVSSVEHVSGQSNKPLSKPAHALTYEAVIQEIRANAEDGLTSSEARLRLDDHGRNELGEGKGTQPGKILIRQVANAMVLVSDSVASPGGYSYETDIHM